MAGATGTGKSVSLMVLAEGFSRLGVPVFLADVKGDLAGLAMSGTPSEKIEQRVTHIGISNVTAEQLTLLCERAAHRPMVVQNRCYASLGWDREVRAICRSHHIIYQGFSLLTANREVFGDPEVRGMAAKYGMGLAQLVFRFAMQVGMLPLTGTTDQQHMKEDLRADQFTIAPEDLQRLETIGM